MYRSIHTPGAIVKVLMTGYEHYAIVSDRIHNGLPMLISLSRRTGTVLEEAWEACTGGRKVVLSEDQGRLAPYQVLAQARSMIGRVEWDFPRLTCEHFARWTHGLKVESKQLKTAVGLIAAITMFMLIFRKCV